MARITINSTDCARRCRKTPAYYRVPELCLNCFKYVWQIFETASIIILSRQKCKLIYCSELAHKKLKKNKIKLVDQRKHWSVFNWEYIYIYIYVARARQSRVQSSKKNWLSSKSRQQMITRLSTEMYFWNSQRWRKKNLSNHNLNVVLSLYLCRQWVKKIKSQHTK